MNNNILYHYDLETSNKSFLDMNNYLLQESIKNNNFMLAIMDKDLIGVDPYDNNLSKETIDKIRTECKNNIWYFLREIIRIKLYDDKYCNFTLTKANCAQIYCASRRTSSWVSAPRQFYKTVSSNCICLWELLFNNDIISVDTFNKLNVSNLSNKIILPSYLSLELSNFTEKIDICSSYIGDENSIIHCSDAEFIDDIDMIVKKPNYYILFESVYNEFYHFTGAKNILTSDNCLKWEENNYDKILKDDCIYHIEFRSTQISENPARYEYIMRKILNCNDNKFNNEVLLNRCEIKDIESVNYRKTPNYKCTTYIKKIENKEE